MPKYVFEGTDMYEVDEVTGVRRLANTTKEPVHGPTPPPIPKTQAQLWMEEREKQRERDNNTGYPGMYGTGYSRPYVSQPGSSYKYVPPAPPVKPWDGIDRAKWPHAWRFMLKLYFLPSYGKETVWVDRPKVVEPEVTTPNPYQWEGSM